jgi:hypothetical protein
VNAQGPIDQNFPPFLWAHMANDPTWIPGEDGVTPLEMARQHNCRFEWDFAMVAARDIEDDEELLVPYCFNEKNTGE